jgi:hypothetical protein
MAVDFSLLNTELPGQIATSFSRGYEGAQKLAQEKEANALNLKIKKEELDAFQQDRQKLLEFGSAMAKLGKDPNPRRIANVLLGSGIPDQIKTGIELAKGIDEHDKIAQIYGLPRSDDLFPSAPTTPAAPVMPGTLGSGTFGMMPESMAAPAQAPANALMPMAAPAQAPANALAPTGRPLTTEERLNALSVVGTPAALRLAALTQQQLNREIGKDKLPEELRLMEALNIPITPGNYIKFKNSTRAPGTTVSINTQLPASEEAQKEFMKEMRQTFAALKQAPTVLENIESAKKLIPQAKGFMGTGGEPLLAAASFLNNRLGTNIDTKGVESAEELRSRLFFGILDNLKKLDSQPSQQQQEALRVALGSIGTDPNALPRVLDAFGNSIRQKVNLYNEEAASAETRGVKFPYKPTIELPSRPGAARPTSGNVVVTPDGRSHSFPTPEAAAQFKKAAGL